jgi:hypothetical protein
LKILVSVVRFRPRPPSFKEPPSGGFSFLQSRLRAALYLIGVCMTKNLAVKAKSKLAKIYVIGAVVFSAILVLLVVLSKIKLTD